MQSPQQGVEPGRIDQLATSILSECLFMEERRQANDTPSPSLVAGTSTAFWSGLQSPELAAARSRALGLLAQLTTLLQGPHDFLHEFAAPNWDHGALYAFLRAETLEHIASSGRATLGHLSAASNIPEDKLARILALLRCKNIVHEPEHEVFTLTTVSEALIRDGDFRAWVEFQLFETRVASVHLADALVTKPNDYTNGTSGFKQGWGAEMYDWHAAHPEKGDRFRRAMRGVSKSLDPADFLIQTWMHHRPPSPRTKVVEIGGRYGFASISLAPEHPDLSFEVRCDSLDFLHRGQAALVTGDDDDPKFTERIAFSHAASLLDPPSPDDAGVVLAYVIRNLFWNWTDDDAVRLLQTLLPTLRADAASSTSTRILVTDGVSPLPDQFPPHVEIAYRRRDITTMTMHNVKQRTQAEWLRMFALVDPDIKVVTSFESSSHVCKGRWELYLEK